MPQDFAIELDDRLIDALESMAQRRGVSLSELAKAVIEEAARQTPQAEAKDHDLTP